MNYGIYIHIPFCIKKCIYCDFLSFSSFDICEDDKIRYFKALEEEWYFKCSLLSSRDYIDSIYIGGGTPSYVDTEYIERILNVIKNSAKIKNDCEITIEVNPGTVNQEKIKKYYEMGINRLSIGVQSTHSRLLSSLGRIHNSADCFETIEYAKNAGFKNINCDLILAVPEICGEAAQTIDELCTDVKAVLDSGITHLSVYSIIIEENTPLFELLNKNAVIEVDENLEREMYYTVNNIAAEYGFKQYEISNYSQPEYMSRHNLKYWKCEPYIGIGLGAASYYPKDKNNANTIYIRETNTKQLTDYNELFFSGEIEEISLNEQMDEFMMLGFRIITGPDSNDFIARFGCSYKNVYKDKLNFLQKKGLIYLKANAYLSNNGLDYANEVFREFYLT